MRSFFRIFCKEPYPDQTEGRASSSLGPFSFPYSQRVRGRVFLGTSPLYSRTFMGCILFLEEGTECLGEEISMSWVLLAWAIVLEVTGTTKYEALPGCLGYARSEERRVGKEW